MNRRIVRFVADLVAFNAGLICVVGAPRFFNDSYFSVFMGVSLGLGAAVAAAMAISQSYRVRHWLGIPVAAMIVLQAIIIARLIWIGEWPNLWLPMMLCLGPVASIAGCWLADRRWNRKTEHSLSIANRVLRCLAAGFGPTAAIVVGVTIWRAFQIPLSHALLFSLHATWYGVLCVVSARLFWKLTSPACHKKPSEQFGILDVKLKFVGIVSYICAAIGFKVSQTEPSLAFSLSMLILAIAAAMVIFRHESDMDAAPDLPTPKLAG